MEKRYIPSSHLSIAEHDGKDNLFITFRNGAKYCYNGVSYSVFDSMTRNESAGKFFHSFIKDKYTCRKM